jgi:SPP1 gp7 family putative phage head morphogenesis protein
MVRVPPGGDWPQVSAAIADRLSARGQLVDGQWRLVALPETGAAIEDFPELDEVPPDQPRGYSTPVLDVDVHRCLLEASSSSNDSGVAKGALEVLRAVWGLDYQIHLSCAGFDPAAKTPEQSAERLAGLRMTARREGIPYDLFVAKNHGTVFVDDKGLRFEDWSAQAAEILARLAAPDPEDEVTSLVPDAAGTAKAVLRKAVETPPTDTHLERAEAHYADVIAKGLSLGLDIRKVTSKWLRSRTTGKAVQNEPPEVAHARAYLQSAGLDTAEVEAALTVLYRDGYMLGQHRAASGLRQVGQQITSQVSAIDWSTWAPGHPAAADALAGPGLRSLLDQSQVTIKSIADTQIDELASRLAQGAANGDSVDTIARGIEDLAGSRGEMIAQTELARAVSSATRDSYVANGVESFDWLAEADACPECDQMAAEGPYDPFQDDMPPLHPRCRCSASPHMLTEEDQAMKARALELSILAKIAERLDQSESTKSSPTLERALEAVKAANERPINITVQPAETHIHEGAVKVEITHQAPGSVTEMEYDRDGRPTRIRRQ